MKYLMVSGSISPTYCGVGKFASKATRILQKHGIEVVYLTNFEQKEYNSKDEKLQVKTMKGPLLKNGWRTLYNAVRDLQPAVVVIQYQSFAGNFGDALFPLIVHLARPKSKAIAVIHEFEHFTRKGKARLSWAMRLSDRVCFSDNQQMVSARKYFGGKPISKFKVIFTGMTVSAHLNSFSDFKFDQNILNIAYHGFIQPAKGLDLLLEALLQTEFPFRLHILGEFRPLLAYGKNEETVFYQQNLLNLIRDNPRLSQNVIIEGDVEPGSQPFQKILAEVELAVFPFMDYLTVRRSSFANTLLNSRATMVSTYKKGISDPFLESTQKIDPTVQSIVEFLNNYVSLNVEERLAINLEQQVMRSYFLDPLRETELVDQLSGVN